MGLIDPRLREDEVGKRCARLRMRLRVPPATDCVTRSYLMDSPPAASPRGGCSSCVAASRCLKTTVRTGTSAEGQLICGPWAKSPTVRVVRAGGNCVTSDAASSEDGSSWQTPPPPDCGRVSHNPVGRERSMAILPWNQYRLRRSRIFKRPSIFALTCTVGVLLGVTLLGAQVPDPTENDIGPPRPAEITAKSRLQTDGRMREGTEVVDQLGHFRVTGARVTFFTDDGQGRFVVLENLNLERIARTIADNPEQLQWGVTGTITEYRGANFLLLRRAALKSQVRPPEDVF